MEEQQDSTPSWYQPEPVVDAAVEAAPAEAAPEAVEQLPETTEPQAQVFLSPEAAVEPADQPEPEPQPEPAPEPVQQSKPSRRAAAAPADVVPDADAVDIVLSALRYPSPTKNSASVRRVQWKLYHAGHPSVSADVDGHYGAGTFQAVRDFQSDAGLPATGVIDMDTLKALFAGDSAVRLVL